MGNKDNPRSLRTVDLRFQERQACRSVLDVYAETKSVVGMTQAMDYSKMTGGRGAIYDPSSKNSPLFDFLIDVELTIKETLTKEEVFQHLNTLLDVNRVVTVEAICKMEERLGRQFVARKIWPVRQYLTTIKR